MKVFCHMLIYLNSSLIIIHCVSDASFHLWVLNDQTEALWDNSAKLSAGENGTGHHSSQKGPEGEDRKTEGRGHEWARVSIIYV